MSTKLFFAALFVIKIIGCNQNVPKLWYICIMEDCGVDLKNEAWYRKIYKYITMQMQTSVKEFVSKGEKKRIYLCICT